MAIFSGMNIAASGMTAQRLRTDIISENIANANTTRTAVRLSTEADVFRHRSTALRIN